MDDTQRIAMMETRTVDNAGDDKSPEHLIRFQLSNHLGSASLELDDSAGIISYEEYTPYGSTTYNSVRSNNELPKRYRFTGMERDEETGLAYHAARYFSNWLGRWTAADPKGTIDGACLYCYCRGTPNNLVDRKGTNSLLPVPGELSFGNLWQRAVQQTLGKPYNEAISTFQQKVQSAIDAHGGWKGTNRQKGTGVNIARETYSKVRTNFGKIATLAGFDLTNVQVHHFFDFLAANPHEALNPTNLAATRGNTAVLGTEHNVAEMAKNLLEERRRNGQKIGNPGQEVIERLAKLGIKIDVQNLKGALAKISVPGGGSSKGKAMLAGTALVVGFIATFLPSTAEAAPTKETTPEAATPAPQKTPLDNIEHAANTAGVGIEIGSAALSIHPQGDVIVMGATAIYFSTESRIEQTGADDLIAHLGQAAETQTTELGATEGESQVAGAAVAAGSAIAAGVGLLAFGSGAPVLANLVPDLSKLF